MKWIGINSTSDTSLADITSVVAGTGLTGGGTSGDVTLNVANPLNQDTSGTAAFANLAAQATILANTRTINDVDFNGSADIVVAAAAGTLAGSELKSTVTGSALTSVGTITSGKWNSATEAIPSAYLDADTAHLSGIQTFTGLKTFSMPIITDGDRSFTPGDGVAIHVDAFDVTDTSTSASGTAALYTHVKIEAPRVKAANASVTTTDAASLYIQGPPVSSTNNTITNPYALWVDSGDVKFDGALTVSGDVSGTLATAAQPNITTLAGLTSFGSAGATTNIVAGDLTMYNPVNDGNPRFSIGAAGAESFYINPYYDSGAQTLRYADIGTSTADTGANAGYLRFVVDGSVICTIMDDGIQLMDGAGLTIGNSTTGTVDIITDNGSGTTTLSNIDALDATTISTLNAALTAGDITGVTAGTGLSGGGASGAVTLNVDAAQTQITSVGTIGTGAWNATPIATAYIADDAVTQAKLADSINAAIAANTAKTTNRAYFEFKGFGTSDGTNYEMAELMTDANAPFEHDTSTGSDGLTAQTIQTIIRSGGTVMPRAGTITAFTGWNTSAGSGTVDVGIFKVTPTDDTAGNLTPVLLVNEQTTASGNAKPNSFSESSFSVGFAAGDIIYSAVKGGTASKTWYFTSTLEVQWS